MLNSQAHIADGDKPVCEGMIAVYHCDAFAYPSWNARCGDTEL